MRALAVDLGDVRIGLAVSDPAGLVATPLETLPVRDAQAVGRIVDDLAEVAERTGAEVVVVGLPRALSGEEGPAAQRARAVAERLERVTALPVHLWDERFTTVEAERSMLAQGAKRRQRRAVVDRVAATLMLQAFLDARRARESPDEGEVPGTL